MLQGSTLELKDGGVVLDGKSISHQGLSQDQLLAVTYNLLRARLQDAKVAKLRPLSCLQLSHQDFRGPSEAVLLYVVDKFYRSIASFPHATHGRHSSLASRSGHQCHGPDTLCVTACEFSCWVSTLTTLLVRMPGLKHLNAYANGPAMISCGSWEEFGRNVAMSCLESISLFQHVPLVDGQIASFFQGLQLASAHKVSSLQVIDIQSDEYLSMDVAFDHVTPFLIRPDHSRNLSLLSIGAKHQSSPSFEASFRFVAHLWRSNFGLTYLHMALFDQPFFISPGDPLFELIGRMIDQVETYRTPPIRRPPRELELPGLRSVLGLVKTEQDSKEVIALRNFATSNDRGIILPNLIKIVASRNALLRIKTQGAGFRALSIARMLLHNRSHIQGDSKASTSRLQSMPDNVLKMILFFVPGSPAILSSRQHAAIWNYAKDTKALEEIQKIQTYNLCPLDCRNRQECRGDVKENIKMHVLRSISCQHFDPTL